MIYSEHDKNILESLLDENKSTNSNISSLTNISNIIARQNAFISVFLLFFFIILVVIVIYYYLV